jgi:hypothetical protein
MITIELMGGLGNQLFQIFALIGYSMDNKTSFYIEDKEIIYGDRKTYYWDTFLSNIGKFIKPTVEYEAIVREKGFNYKPLPKLTNKKQIVKMMGYFQSHKYFDNHYNNIIKFLKLDEKRVPYKDNYDYQYTISLHFRVGDYKELPEHHTLLTPIYYIKALQHISAETGRTNWQVLYFCEDEDIEYVDKQIAIINEELPELSFIKIESTYSDWQQMLIMSLCEHNIIANSSFSWWGAYFNNKKNIVCYPKTWFGPKQGVKDMSDLFPLSWAQIEA